MICHDFKDWLINRDMLDERIEGTAREHLEICERCRKLYRMDSRVEAQLAHGLREIDVPDGLYSRIEMDIQSATKDKPALHLTWKILAPAVAMAALVLLIFNPFAGKFRGVEEIALLAVEDHLRDLTMTVKAEQVTDITGWFEERLGYKISIPDLGSQGFQFVGGRKCRLGGKDVGYLLYEKNGERASLFIIQDRDLNFRMEAAGTYNLTLKECHVKIWKQEKQVYALVE